MLLLLVALAWAPSARGELYVWVSRDGQTHATNDPKAVPGGAGHALRDTADLDTVWGGRLTGPVPLPAPDATDPEEARIRRILAGALDDLAHGDTARAITELDSVLRLEPNRPEAHWYLALLDRQRGDYASSEAHLEAFLANAGDAFDAWRASAERRLAALRDERRLEAAETPSAPLRFVTLESPHFRIRYDARLGADSPDYARTVIRYLEDAYADVGRMLGVAPERTVNVVLYGRGAYLASTRHRFSFPTVGYFDGTIRVASAAHPAGELRALLFHEYTHALFREHTGGDRPFWLNEGLAELSERFSRHEPPLDQDHLAFLERQIEAGAWIPLRSLAASFSGLDEASARLAYLESTAAASWIAQRAGPAQRGRLLSLLGHGVGVDAALRDVLGVDTAGLDAALRRSIRDQFPPEVIRLTPAVASGPPS